MTTQSQKVLRGKFRLMGRDNWAFNLFTGLIIFSICGTLVSRIFHSDPGLIAQITLLLIILAGAVCVGRQVSSRPALFIALTIGLLATILNSVSGLPFGHFKLQGTWWPVIPFGASLLPLVLPIVWLMIATGSFLTLRRFFSPGGAAVGGAIMAALIDLPSEMALTKIFNFWHWKGDGGFGAPIQNTLAWFVLSLISGFLLASSQKRKVIDATPAHVLSLFCALLAITGLATFFHFAWILLAVMSASLWIVGNQLPAKDAAKKN